mgnify:CR=1 FL=1
MAVFFFTAQVAWAGNIKTEKVTLVGNGIVEFIPVGYDVSRTPSLILSHEPEKKGEVPENWKLVPQFTMTDGKANASLDVPAGTSLYGGGEVTGPLLRNGQKIKMWNTDNGMYRVDGGSRLYQTHPWVLGVRPDGTAFGVLFDSFWKAELITNSDKIEFNTEGAPFRTYIIDRESPQAVLKGLAELTGTISMPPRWAIGYHQSRFSYVPEARVKEVANTFREKKIPCDVIWFDINYMDEFRVFTINNRDFPDPKRMNKYLHDNGFHSVYMIDPGVKVDDNYFVYKTGKEQNAFVCDIYRNEFHGKVWPGACAFPDFTRPETRTWWSGLYKDFMANGIDGIWNDMNEPASFNGELPQDVVFTDEDREITHAEMHNIYGHLMSKATYEGLKKWDQKRPFVITRACYAGSQKYTTFWTGDNQSLWAHLQMAIPQLCNMGLSGLSFVGTDVGGFGADTTGELLARWVQVGCFSPLFRNHCAKGNINQEPWLFGDEVREIYKKYVELRYRLLPYLYDLFREEEQTGMPVMRPLVLHYEKDPETFTKNDEFLFGERILVAPVTEQGAHKKMVYLPEGEWYDYDTREKISGGKYFLKEAPLSVCPIYVKAGTVLPNYEPMHYIGEKELDTLVLDVYPGDGSYVNYQDNGEDFAYRDGAYNLYRFTQSGGKLTIELIHDGYEKKYRQFVIRSGGREQTVSFTGEALKVKL